MQSTDGRDESWDDPSMLTLLLQHLRLRVALRVGMHLHTSPEPPPSTLVTEFDRVIKHLDNLGNHPGASRQRTKALHEGVQLALKTFSWLEQASLTQEQLPRRGNFAQALRSMPRTLASKRTRNAELRERAPLEHELVRLQQSLSASEHTPSN